MPQLTLISEPDFKNCYARIDRIYGTACDVFLMNPSWSEAQIGEARKLIENYRTRETNTASSGKIFVASGGSGGKIRFVAHTQNTLEASARALIRMLDIQTPLNCFACLPPWHISGLMPYVRSRVSGGKLFVANDFGFHFEHSLAPFRQSPEEFWMNSLVPTQLRRILALPGGAEWLRDFDFILLGGAAVPAELIAQAVAKNLKIGIGYGMTETASLVALWTPDSGSAIAGTPLPHATISLAEDSRIAISADSLGETLGENGELAPNVGNVFLTNDEGKFDSQGRICVLGRADRYINSGGEKIDPLLVENALRQAGAETALVVGEKDAEWGERVVALVVSEIDVPALNAATKKILPPWMMPKRILRVSALPYDAKGKLDRTALRAILDANSKRN